VQASALIAGLVLPGLAAWLFLIAALAAGSLCSVILYWLRRRSEA